jgi:uncharacterized protein YyaL (SSP411 family)
LETYSGTTHRPAFNDLPPTHENARAGALRAADWLQRTQVSTAENLSGDTGRYYGIRGLYDNASYLTQNWLAAHCVLGVLAAWHATSTPAYLTSARLGSEYLLGLQVLDPRRTKAYGGYREHHARFPLIGARSGCSVIWALSRMFQVTQDEEYLDSARLYADWFLRYAFPQGAVFPAPEYIMTTDRWSADWHHVCFGGVGVIFHQLYRLTRTEEYLQRGVIEIADRFMTYFLQPDGSRFQTVSPDGQRTPVGDASFHRYNDDFAGISLLAAYRETRDEKYLEASLRLARWLVGQTEPNGRLGGVSSAPATAMIHMLALRKMTGSHEFDEVMARYVAYLLRYQVLEATSAEFHGGIRGQSHVNSHDESGHYIDGRTTSYAICALLGFADPSARILLEVEA